MELPRIIQGGMGAGVSGWVLARAVASLGQLGVVSGTALDTILVRRLQDGDLGGHMRRAMAAFPVPAIAEHVLQKYFREGGVPTAKSETPLEVGEPDAAPHEAADSKPLAMNGRERTEQRYKLVPMMRASFSEERNGLVALANFVEVYLAKEGHRGVVGINLLEKIQMPNLPSLYGAMLAGVDVVLMGAGIPAEIPAVLDRLAQHLDVSIALDVLDRVQGDENSELKFDPRTLVGEAVTRNPLRRPQFLPIIASVVLAKALLKKAPGGIAGFVIEGPTAGGHNAPPRGQQKLSDRGEPVYGDRDVVDLDQMKALGLPFWLAGSYSSREKVTAAIAAGARGIQAGTVFALCAESGLTPALREQVLQRVLSGEASVFTDPLASPTGFPFKVVGMERTLSQAAVYEDRPRLCDLGYLRRAYRKEDGTLGYRCPSEPVDDYVHKGGRLEDTVGRKCLCNGLVANIGQAQHRPDGYEELPLVTSGDDLECVKKHIAPGRLSYTAREVIESLLPLA